MITKIIKRLGIKPRDKIAVIGNAHDSVQHAPVNGYPPMPREKYHKIFAYTHTVEDIGQAISEVDQTHMMAISGLLFFLFPKPQNPLGIPGMEFDQVLNYLNTSLPVPLDTLGYKLHKQIKVDEVYNCISLQKEALEMRYNLTEDSQLEEYIECMEYLVGILPEEIQVLYLALSEEEQLSWAGYIFMARRQTTRRTRIIQLFLELVISYYAIHQTYPPKP